ncbi:hypothetical protein [Methanolobus psychrotolerans]|uniref:hypothetical protein n=1 Tax=Methanolobus psychrotolerans TaxID=1874706 RepID=UPI000B91A5F6|nr:hypothetical protein [Methanolobus psychrotolerans]
MKIRAFTLIAVAIMLVSLFTITAMAADQQRDRDQDCTGVPEDALRTQTRAGINAGGMVTGVCDSSNCDGDGVCDSFVDEDGDGICDNCQGDGVPDRLHQKLRNGSCQE